MKPSDLVVLVEAVKLAEEIKPSQHAKREVFKKHGILGTDRDRMLTALFYSIMKRQGILDKVISRVTGVESPLILDPWLRAALRVAVELILFHETPQPVMKFLRWKVASYLSNITHPYVGMYYWKLIDKIKEYKFSPKDEVEELEFKYMLPRWFIEKMMSILDTEEANELFKALNRKPLISVRVNTLKATVEEVLEELRKEGIKPIQSPRIPVVIKFKGPFNFDKSPLYRNGKIIIQEEASAAASLILAPRPGELVVDLCAAPGGKTTHLAEIMKNKGKIYAFDIDKKRLKRMKMLLKRCGINIVEIFEEDNSRAPEILGEEIADKVLLDPPCSSDGTIAKNPELRWRIRQDKIPELARMQYMMLETAVKLVKPGGRILYCTCSMFPEENEEVVGKLLKEHKEIRLIELSTPYSPGFLKGTMRAWPHKHDTIGFFYALLEKTEKK